MNEALTLTEHELLLKYKVGSKVFDKTAELEWLVMEHIHDTNGIRLICSPLDCNCSDEQNKVMQLTSVPKVFLASELI
jgi:hypothetical protein